MQVVYGDASNIYLTAQKRLIRVVYGQTQATPYACVLDPNLRNAEGEIEVPAESATKPFKRSKAVFTYKNSIVPGTVLVKTEGEYVAPAAGVAGERPFGLLGQWVGGTFDNIKASNQVAAWQGFDAVLDILKPAFNEKAEEGGKKTITELLASQKAEYEKGTEAGYEVGRVLVAAGKNGLLTAYTQKEIGELKYIAVGEVVQLVNANVLRIKLLV